MVAGDMTEQLNPTTGGDERSGVPWKTKVEEPINRFVHYPLARRIVPWLARTPITPNQVTLAQLPLAVVATWLIAVGGTLYTVLGLLVFGLRSLLDCVDGTLARAKNMATSKGHALDAFVDWVSCTILYAGVYAHFWLHPPSSDSWFSVLPVGLIVALALVNGGARSFASDHYKQKLGAIFDRGRDETVEATQKRLLVLRGDRSFSALLEAWIAWSGHLTFELERFDPERTRPLSAAEVAALQQVKEKPLARLIAGMWSISSGDFWVTITLAGALFGVLWPTVVFLATAGFVWIVLAVILTNWFVRRTAARAELVTA